MGEKQNIENCYLLTKSYVFIPFPNNWLYMAAIIVYLYNSFSHDDKFKTTTNNQSLICWKHNNQPNHTSINQTRARWLTFAGVSLLCPGCKNQWKETALKTNTNKMWNMPPAILCHVDECCPTTWWSADKAPHLLKPNPPPTQAHGCPGPSPLPPSLNSFWEV